MTYDQWKTTDPRDYEPDYDSLHYDHDCGESFSIDHAGCAICDRCGETWWPNADEVAAYREREAEQDAWLRQRARREFWRKVTYPIRWPIFRLLERVWPRKAIRVLLDEEIPF